MSHRERDSEGRKAKLHPIPERFADRLEMSIIFFFEI
jgi:hypothetical protein